MRVLHNYCKKQSKGWEKSSVNFFSIGKSGILNILNYNSWYIHFASIYKIEVYKPEAFYILCCCCDMIQKSVIEVTMLLVTLSDSVSEVFTCSSGKENVAKPN